MNRLLISELANGEIEIAKKIHGVFQRSYKIEADLIGAEDFPPLKRSVNDFQKSNTYFYGAWKGEDLSSIIEVNIDELKLEICSLVVNPKYFRQGIGSKMMKFILEKHPRNKTLVETASANQPAIRLYEKHGFKITRKWMLDIGIEKVELMRIE